MGPVAVSGRPNAGESENEAAAAAVGTRKEQGEAKAVTEEGEGLKADFNSHGTGGVGRLWGEGERGGAVWSCQAARLFLPDTSLGVSPRSGGQVGGSWRCWLSHSRRVGRACWGLGSRALWLSNWWWVLVFSFQ